MNPLLLIFLPYGSLCSLVIFSQASEKYPQCIAGVSGSVIPTILFTKGIEIEANQWGLREMVITFHILLRIKTMLVYVCKLRVVVMFLVNVPWIETLLHRYTDARYMSEGMNAFRSHVYHLEYDPRK
jgi:hypothetical protein